MRATRVTAVLLALGAALVGAGVAQPSPLTIYAAASLTGAFSAYDTSQRYSFAGSSTLEAQIRNGAPADLFASAAPLNTQRLYAARLVERPITFTANRLVLIVPEANAAGIRSVYDLRRKRVELVVANPAVPAGSYTRSVLRKLGLSSLLSSVVSQEPDVKAVTGKVAVGQADAGFVYATDALAAADKVRVIALPAAGQPRIRYEVAVVSASSRKAEARAWIKGLLSPRGQAALRRAGFLAAPRGSS